MEKKREGDMVRPAEGASSEAQLPKGKVSLLESQEITL